MKNSDFEKAFGEHYCGGISNNYRLVREAVERAMFIDDVKPDSNVINDIKAVLFKQNENIEDEKSSSMFSLGRNFFKKKSA